MAGYISLIDLGIHKPILNRLTKSHSKGDLKEFTAVFQSALRLFLLLIIIALVSFYIFVSSSPINKWLNINITNPIVLKWAIIVLGIWFLLSLLSELFKNVYISLGEYIRAAMLYNIKELALILILAMALIRKSNFIAVSSLHLIPLSAIVLYYLWDINRRYDGKILLGFSSADWKLSFSFTRTGLFFFLIVLGYALNLQGSILVISNILGAGAVAVFSIHRTVAHSLIKIVSTVSYPLWPELTAAEARGDYKKLQLIFNILIKIALLISFSMAIFLFFKGKDIIKILTGGRIEFEPLLWLLLLIYIPLRIFWSTCGLFQTATNRPRRLALAWFSSNVLGLALAIAFTKRWGIAGTLAGLAIPEVVICLWTVPGETLKIIRNDRREFWLFTVGKGLAIALAQLLIAFILYSLIINNILQFIALFLGISFSGILAGYLLWLTQEERKILKDGLYTIKSAQGN